MFVATQPLPMHRVCPKSGAMIFDPSPNELALDQVKRISRAMLKVTDALALGEKPPTEALQIMRELGS